MCMGGQMHCRRPKHLSGPYVNHPMGKALQHEITRGRGRIENNELFSIKVFFWMQTDKAKKMSRFKQFMCKAVRVKREILEIKPFLTSATIIIHADLVTNRQRYRILHVPVCLKQRSVFHLNS